MPLWSLQVGAAGVGRFHGPIPWYQSGHSLVSLLAVPVLLYGWRRQAARGREPSEIGKIGIGAWLMAASNLILAAATLGSGGAPINPIWPLLYCLSLAISFMYYWPTLLALVSRTAPVRVNAMMMGIAFISLFIANNLIGWLGSFYEHMNPAQFWAMHATIAAIGAILVRVVASVLPPTLPPTRHLASFRHQLS